MGFLKEFKDFTIKGNVIDLTVGVVIGAAFGKIVTSLVEDIIMPPIGYLTGGVNFSEMKIILKESIGNKPEVAIRYGNLITVAIQFILIAFAIFIVVKIINKLRRKDEEKPVTPPAPTNEEKLLTEIRDILKKNKEDS